MPMVDDRKFSDLIISRVMSVSAELVLGVLLIPRVCHLLESGSLDHP